jgi:hypothetical protein
MVEEGFKEVGQKIGKPNNLIVLGTQYLWVLMLCRSFFTPGRDIGSTELRQIDKRCIHVVFFFLFDSFFLRLVC